MRILWNQIRLLVAVAVIASSTSSVLGDDNVTHVVNPDDWLDECFETFLGKCCVAEGDPHIPFSNFFLIDKPSGLCADHLSCAFEKCDPSGIAEAAALIATTPTATYSDVADLFGDLNLPTEIAFPSTASHVVAAIQHAKKEGLTVSIKSTGHSYAGSNTKKDSVQLNMRNYNKYSQVAQPVVECNKNEDSSEDVNACSLATARGKNAIIKVGGGETWSDVYLAVIDASATYTSIKYDIVGGGAGSVGAAGGWLQGGGWSTGLERLYGLGVDQVLELEMILADERHVKFGPVEWEDAPGFLYPRTTVVDGLCNTNIVEMEDEWKWEPCEEPLPPFNDLWYAVRGGGGGTYGLVTSLKYQLHTARNVEPIIRNEEAFASIMGRIGNKEDELKQITSAWILFLKDLLYDPAKLGLDEATSALCGSPALHFNFMRSTFMLCYDNIWSDLVLDKWHERVDAMDDELSDNKADLKNLWTSFSIGSYPELFQLAPNDPNVWPVDSIPDNPLPSFVPDKGFGGWCSAVIPKRFLTDTKNEDDLVNLFSIFGGEHTTGGYMNIAHDQMTAISHFQRESGLSSVSLAYVDEENISRLLTEFVKDSGDMFPGISEVNHICPNSYGPLKTNFTKPCPSTYSTEQKEAECISIQESLWGTEVLTKLEDIKYKVDPENLFDCYTCVKPAKQITNEPVVMVPTAAPSDSDSAAPISFPSVHWSVLSSWIMILVGLMY